MILANHVFRMVNISIPSPRDCTVCNMYEVDLWTLSMRDAQSRGYRQNVLARMRRRTGPYSVRRGSPPDRMRVHAACQEDNDYGIGVGDVPLDVCGNVLLDVSSADDGSTMGVVEEVLVAVPVVPTCFCTVSDFCVTSFNTITTWSI